MSGTMSSPTDWPQFYQQNLSNQESMFGEQGYDTSTVVSTTITSSSASSPPLGSVPAASSSGGGHLSPEGRVGKPVRRRSRTSRRTPTTLLNTDTTNFRAMVQQFTGGPSTSPFAAGSAHPGGLNLGFGFVGRRPHVNPASSLMVPPAGFQLQYRQQQQQQHQLMQQQNQAYMFSLNSNNNPGAGGGDLFLQRLGGNPRPNMEAGSEGFVAEGTVSSQVPLPPSRTTSSNENRSNTTFMF